MFANQVLGSEEFQVFCPNMECRLEKMNAYGRLIRKHRRMNYVGSITVGWSEMIFSRFVGDFHFPESGTYHCFSCPVCGADAIYQEKWGMYRRVFCGHLALNP